MFTTKNPNFRAVIADKLERQYFMRHIGFELTVIKEGYIEGQGQIQQFHKQQNEFVHGGVVSTLCDIVAGFSAFSLVEPNKHVVTAEIKVACLRPGIGEVLLAKGWVLKPGKGFHFCESEVYTLQKNRKVLIAKASSTMAVVDQFRSVDQ